MHKKGMVKYFPECNLEVDFFLTLHIWKTKSGEVTIRGDKGKGDSKIGS
jgi:hypothetical protein